jgi:hypothetical protein
MLSWNAELLVLHYRQTYMRHPETSRKVVGLYPDEVTEYSIYLILSAAP